MFPTEFTMAAVRAAYQKKKLLPSEVIEYCKKEIEGEEKNIHAFLDIPWENIKKQTVALESRIAEIDTLPLFGIPLAIKDLFLVKGSKTTAGSKILENYVSPFTASCIARLEKAGAILIGKTNLDEFAMGSSTENSAFGNTANPWDKARVPGGSSGGSAAALAAHFCLGSIGTDTGGSIRQPASFCGVVGLKPSYGRVSRYGIIAFASSLDQAGPFGLTVSDTALLLEILAGHDPLDATSSKKEVPLYSRNLEDFSFFGKRLGVPRKLLQGLEPQVESSFQNSLSLMESKGAKIIEIDLAHAKYALSAYYIIAPCEASSNLARFDGVHYGYRSPKAHSTEEIYTFSRGEGFGPEVKQRIMLGTYALSAGYFDAFYGKANQVRHRIRQDFETAFSDCDFILTPTSPSTAFRFGEKSTDPIQMYLADVFTIPVNLAGIPAISIPCGLDENQLPIGIQFIAPHFAEEKLFQVGHCFESLRGKFPSYKEKNKK